LELRLEERRQQGIDLQKAVARQLNSAIVSVDSA
jgi:hypothetical protein